jgi:hypothetical protein
MCVKHELCFYYYLYGFHTSGGWMKFMHLTQQLQRFLNLIIYFAAHTRVWSVNRTPYLIVLRVCIIDNIDYT